MQSQFHQFPQGSRKSAIHSVWAVLATLVLLLGVSAQAQVANIYGSLGNFDIVNNSGHDAHGFEVELEGVYAKDVISTFTYQRYGNPTYHPTATGVIVRWMSTYNAVSQTWAQTTVAYNRGGNFGGTCYMGTATYATSGCEHFGVHFSYYSGVNPTKTTHRWLIADPANPGMLIGTAQPAPIPAPVYTVVPPVQAGNPPVLVAEFEAPEPPEAPELYGDAQWVKVFKTQLNRQVTLDELLTTNPIVPQDPAQIETQWDLVQAEPPSNSNGNRRRHQNQGGLDPLTRAVVRRYETYAYTGAYDPVTHQAVCADLTCSAPAANEIGDLIGAQMAAANVEVNAVIVAKTGNGSISSTDRIVSCGSKCVASYNAGSAVTLVAQAGSNSLFTGWTGACTGNALNCVVTVNGQTNVGANFVTPVTLQVKTSGGKGSITSTNSNINCGRVCSATTAPGVNVTLTATPEPGFRFVNWTGGCTGTSATCTLTVNSNTSVQANFTK